MTKFNALLLPSERPLHGSKIKRHLLFFDSVLLPDPSDTALVHDGEVQESFKNGMMMSWSRRVPFPRTEDYEDVLGEIQRETTRLQGQGKLRFLTQKVRRDKLDPGLNWTSYSCAITDSRLVRAAAVDSAAGLPPVKFPSGVYTGFSIAPGGEKSRYEVPTQQPVAAGVGDERWDALCWSRIGRTLKFMRRATIEDAYPVATDEATASILMAMSGSNISAPPEGDALSDLAIALDVIDEDELEKALLDMSWDEVLRLRKEVLPHVRRLREVVRQNIRVAQLSTSVDFGMYRAEVVRLRSDYAKERDALTQEWSKLKIVSASNFLAVSSVAVAGLTGLVLPHITLGGLIVSIIAAGLAAGAKVGSDVGPYVVARDKLATSPVFFFDRLPRQIIDRARSSSHT